MTPLSLARRSLDRLSATFKKNNHVPDDDMWKALTHLALTMEAAVEGSLDKNVFVTSLDPGVGKTQSVIQFMHCLLSSSYKDVGVLICVSRINEVKSYVEELGLAKELFCVVTSDMELNKLGSTAETAPIMITTQQMIESRCHEGSFETVGAFQYQGRSRKLRIWDEAILPGKTITLKRLDIAGLLQPVHSRYPALSDQLDVLFNDIKGMVDGHHFRIPDFQAEFDVEVNEVLGLLDGNEKLKTAASALWFLSGRLVAVRKDDRNGNCVLDFKETLPDDLLPLIVLDASARIRATYSLWARDRGGLSTLTSAAKRYDDLTVHVWQTGGGKWAFHKDGSRLVEGVASTINTKPHEQWLVVHHRSQGGLDIENDVRDLIVASQSNVHFISWGNHQATNAYKDVSNVILAGTLFYPASHYEALGRLASNKPASTGKFPKSDEAKIILGEHSHLILQALCRGAVRRCIDGKCAPCDAYVIASVRSGIPVVIPDIFPGCAIKKWLPVPKALKGKVRYAVDYLAKRLRDDPEAFVRFKEVRDAIGIASNSNFRKNIRRHSDFQEAISNLGVMEDLYGRYSTGFVKSSWQHYLDAANTIAA